MPELRKALSRGILLFLILLLVIAVAGVVGIRWMGRDEVPAGLKVPDGVMISVAGADYGTNHVLGSRLARWTARTPPKVQAFLKRIFGSRAVPGQILFTSTPRLVVWMNLPKPPAQKTGWSPPGSYLLYLADAGGFASGTGQNVGLGFQRPLPLPFDVFPRRERTILMKVFYRDNSDHLDRWTNCGTLSFVNPAYRTYPQWQPEVLPATNRTGDIEATLEEFKTDQGAGTSNLELPNGGRAVTFPAKPWNVDNRTACLLKLRSLSNPMRQWQAIHAEVSDATGNVLNDGAASGFGDSSLYTFQPGLWTNEAAWKVRFEVRCARGFDPGDLITFSNVPLPEMFQTNRLEWSASANGTTVTLDYVVRRQPFTSGGWDSRLMSSAMFTIPAVPGLSVEYVSAWADHTNFAQCRSGQNGENWIRRDLGIPADAKTLDVTLGVSHNQWVEFMVKPETGPARFEFPPPKIWMGAPNHR